MYPWLGLTSNDFEFFVSSQHLIGYKPLQNIVQQKVLTENECFVKKDRFRSDKCFYRDGITTISVFNVMRFFRNSLYVTIPKTKLPKSHSLSPFFPKKSKKASFLLCNIYFVKQTTKYAFYGINKPCKISHICKAMAHFKAVFILYCYDVKLHKYYNNLPKLHL